MYERIYIAEYIYDGVVEPSYKKSTRPDPNLAMEHLVPRKNTQYTSN